MRGIVSYGAYVPYWRLQRGAIARALGARRRQGHPRVAAYDEDTTSMGVEAARIALRAAPDGAARRASWSSPRPRRPTSTRPTPRHPCRARPAVAAPAPTT